VASRILVVSGPDIESHISAAALIPAVAQGYRALGRTEAELSPKFHWEFVAGRSAAFASVLPAWGAMATKVASVRPANPQHGLPTGISQVLLHRAETGELLALLDGKAVTIMRTGAAAAVGAIALARPRSSVVALFGPGVVGKACLDAIASAFPIAHAYIVGVDQEEAARFVALHQSAYPFPIVPSAGDEAVRRADIVLTVTPSTTPIVRDAWVRDGTHISAMGADWRGKQELETAILRRSLFVTDNRTQCLEIGEANVPHSAGQFETNGIHAEIGEILTGTKGGRRDATQVTVFDSSGIAVQDLAAAYHIYQLAVEGGYGVHVEL
jgi:alanine dehydrogenase